MEIRWKRGLISAGLVSGMGFLAACSTTYKVPMSAYGPQPDDLYYEARKSAVESHIYNFVPRKAEQLRPFDPRWVTWCFVGNENDGIFGEYSGRAPYSTNINGKTFCSWSILRNPLHNFDFYVIGSARWKRHYNYSLLSFGGGDKVRALTTPSKERRRQPSFDIGFNDFKPYLKCNPWVMDLYFGWRKNGSFEVKLRADLEQPQRRERQAAKQAVATIEPSGRSH